MVDLDILKKYGTDNAAIKALFTAEAGSPLYDHKKRAENRICARLYDGWTYSLQNSHLFAASDLAWDAAPIVRENIPLLLYAQKKIKIERAAEELEKLNCAAHFVRKNSDGTIKEIDLPRLYETSVNLVRSYITRRLAPQSTKYSGLFPFMKYEPRTTDIVGKLRGDATSQRVEIMTDQYNYRHLQTQIIRDMMLYGKCVLFPACAWDREVQWQKAQRSSAFTTNTGEFEVEAKVIREGVDFVRPHPSRVFWDYIHPLSSINTNTGCNYAGFWDLRKFGDINNNTDYFNREKVRISTKGRDFYTTYPLYFDTQFNAQRIRFSTIADLRAEDPASGNDVMALAPYYQSSEADETIFITEYYEKVVPNQCGLGSYPFPVWMRLVVASDDTVIFGEFLPTSSPAIYFGYNENDHRSQNVSLAHEIMPFQDQISNLLSQLLLTAKTGALNIVTLDIDSVSDDIRKGVKETLAGDKYYVTPILLEYSGIKARNLGATQGAIQPVDIIEKAQGEQITVYFNAIAQLLSIVERMLILSPQELGQTASHEISATESNEIAASTSTVYNYISDAIDEGRASWKRFIYESLVNKETSTIRVPIVDRYSKEAIEKAGFNLVNPESAADYSTAQQMITGSKDKLIHEYVFTARDGSDRPSNSQSANVLVQLLGQVVNVPGVLEGMGKRKLYEMINEIFRMSGAGYDLQLEVKDGESDSFGPSEEDQQKQKDAQQDQMDMQQEQHMAQVEQTQQQHSQMMEQMVKQLEAALQQQGDELAKTEAAVQQLSETLIQLSQPQQPAR